jgi:hypothetical protein
VPGWASDDAAQNKNATDLESQQQSADKSTEFVIEAETLKAMQKHHLALRILYMIAAILMASAAVVRILAGITDLGIFFFAIYTLFFATQICCFELALNVSRYFLKKSSN